MIPTNPFLWLIHTVIQLYIYILIATAVLSWLVAFNVVNIRNPICAHAIGDFLYQVDRTGRCGRSATYAEPGRARYFARHSDDRADVPGQFVIWAYVKIVFGV